MLYLLSCTHVVFVFSCETRNAAFRDPEAASRCDVRR
jgi:hypothetical protein